MEAVDRIKSLTSQQSELEAAKKSLMIRRTKLFEEFTSKLQGLPVAVKKKAVMVSCISYVDVNLCFTRELVFFI